jgi:predicted Zn-dependent protease
MGVNDSAKAAIASAQQNYTKAATFLASEVKKSPGDPEKRYRYAIALLKAGREKEAVVQSRMALNLSSENATYLALFNRARAANEKRQPAAE